MHCPSLQEPLLISRQCLSILLLPLVPRAALSAHLPQAWGDPNMQLGWTRVFCTGICSLQCDARASVGLSHAVNSAPSCPAVGNELRAFLSRTMGGPGGL